ncbi:uncharacterized protein METZ01_LOCUS288698 [marine metagenome]|uniref:Uncharacterized protein n=1 Tax=marine metagenome TaxID=408172 RepID=A0A382LG44_9ZZZZ
MKGEYGADCILSVILEISGMMKRSMAGRPLSA